MSSNSSAYMENLILSSTWKLFSENPMIALRKGSKNTTIEKDSEIILLKAYHKENCHTSLALKF